MADADGYRTRSVSLRGVVTAAPLDSATQRGRCGYSAETSAIPNFATIPINV